WAALRAAEPPSHAHAWTSFDGCVFHAAWEGTHGTDGTRGGLKGELRPQRFGDGDRLEGAGGLEGDADAGEGAAGEETLALEEVDFVGEGFAADLGDAELEGQLVLEARGAEELAGAGDAGPADLDRLVGHHDREAQGAEEGVFDDLHPAEV